MAKYELSREMNECHLNQMKLEPGTVPFLSFDWISLWIVIEYDVIMLEIDSILIEEMLFLFFQLDLERPLEEQGPFQLVLHKFTDKFGRAEEGDPDAICDLQKLEVHFSTFTKRDHQSFHQEGHFSSNHYLALPLPAGMVRTCTQYRPNQIGSTWSAPRPYLAFYFLFWFGMFGSDLSIGIQ